MATLKVWVTPHYGLNCFCKERSVEGNHIWEQKPCGQQRSTLLREEKRNRGKLLYLFSLNATVSSSAPPAVFPIVSSSLFRGKDLQAQLILFISLEIWEGLTCESLCKTTKGKWQRDRAARYWQSQVSLSA